MRLKKAVLFLSAFAVLSLSVLAGNWMATRPFAWRAAAAGPSYPWKFTVDTAAGIDPVLLGATLTDEEVTWTKPNLDTFTGKSPSAANFNATGEYTLSITDWEKLINFNFSGDQVSGDIAVWAIPDSLATFSISKTSFSGDLSGGLNLVEALTLHSTSVSGDVSLWTQFGAATWISFYNTSVSYGTGNALDALTNVLLGAVRFDSCGWSTAEVDRSLADCVDCGISNEAINVGGTNAAPTSVGDPSSYWTLVEDRGWTVTVTAPQE